MGISFDVDRCITALQQQLVAAMKDLQEELLLGVQQGMLTPEGAADLEAKDIEVVANVIVASVVGGPWAIMDSFGTGTLSDRFNPALKDYMVSDMWNPARGNDLTIRSRPNAPGQRDIFGNPVNGKGKGGVDLEALGIVDTQPPSNAFETATRWMRHNRMRQKIQETVKFFPFGKFIITDKK